VGVRLGAAAWASWAAGGGGLPLLNLVNFCSVLYGARFPFWVGGGCLRWRGLSRVFFSGGPGVVWRDLGGGGGGAGLCRGSRGGGGGGGGGVGGGVAVGSNNT